MHINLNSLKKDHTHYLDRMEALVVASEARTGKQMTPAELAEFDSAERQCRLLASQIGEAERTWRAAGINAGSSGFDPAMLHPGGRIGALAPGQHFRSLGEQLTAIVEAGRPGGKADERLHQVASEMRAASGLNESIGSEGGFLLESTFSTELLNAGMGAAKIAPRCANFPIGANSNSLDLPCVSEVSRAAGSRVGGLQLHWLAEAGDKTPSKPKFRNLHLQLKKLCGLVYCSDEILQDSIVLEAFLRRAFASEFAFVIDDVILRGSGAGQPLGILASPALVSVPKELGQAGKTLTATNVLSMYSRLLASSVDTAVWYYNTDAFPQIASMTIVSGTAGQPCYMPAGGLSGRSYATLLGLPLIPLEQCATLGQPGDLILLDPQRYILATKGGLQVASSVHVRFVADESVIRFLFRLDGMPELSAPITPYQGSALQSAYIVIEERK